MPSREQVEKFVTMVEAGNFVEAMEAFYAPDATAQENGEPPRVGLPALIAHERKTLAAFKQVKARCAGVVIEGDTVVINWQFAFHHPSGAVLRLDELACQTWRGDKLTSERFFYDPRQLRP